MKTVAAILVCGLAFAQAPSPEFALLAQRAVSAQQSGDYSHAADLYRQLLQLDPNQVVTHVNLGITLVNLGRFDEAIAEYGAADRLLPGDARIQKNLALAYEKSGRLSEARTIFKRLHQASPTDGAVTLLLADCALQSGDDTAVVELLQPLGLTDDHSFDYMLGMALLHLRRPEDAQVYLDPILKSPDTAEARFLLGTQMFEASNFPSAVQQFSSAAALNPKLPQLQSYLGEALLLTGDPDGASAAFRHALEADPSDFTANLGLAQILLQRRAYAKALPLADRAVHVRPADVEANLAAGQALAGLGRFAEARPYAEMAASSLPNHWDAHLNFSVVLAGLGENARATEERALGEKLEAAYRAAGIGPDIHELAPDFELPRAESSGTVGLRDFLGKSPVVLVFGSYSCPNFRDSAASLRTLEQRYRDHIPFLLVYIREAHAAGDWQSTRNTGSDADIAAASNVTEKQHLAAMCSQKLHLAFPAVVDGMDNAVAIAYDAWPSRLFVVDANGRVRYSTRLTELDFKPEEMDAVLHGLAPQQQ